jgi:TfoX/Sxy family transcriptional regulator of competence genes
MYRADVFDENQLATYHRQLGYSKADSLNFVGVDQIHKARFRASGSAGWTPSAASKANAVGILPDSTHSEIYASLGWSENEAAQARARAKADLQHAIYIRARSRALTQIVSNVNAAQAAGLMSIDIAANQLVGAGWPQDFAVSLATSNAVKAQVARISKAIARIRHAFDSGEIASAFALDSLSALGVLPDAAQSYVSIWTLEITPGRKRRTASQITKDVAAGVLSTADALARLTNLGVPPQDLPLYLHDIQSQVATSESRLLASQDRILRARTKALEQAARQAEQTRKAAIAALRREQSPADLKKWAEEGLINQAYYRNRLELYGYDQPSIDLHVEEICVKNPEFCQTQPAQQAGTNGQQPSSG